MPRIALALLLTLTTLATANTAAPAAAQTPITLASLNVSLWPEYDRPAALVILDGQLAPEAALPASLDIRMPARAGQPHAVAVVGPGGQLLTAAYSTRPDGGDIIVTFQVESPGFRVEYYDPALAVEGEARTYVFEWQTGYAIAAATVRVQQPAGARDLAGEPALTALGAAGDGLSYYQADWGAVAPGDRLGLRLTYNKTGSALTAESLAAAPVPQPVPPAAVPNPGLPWVIGGAVLGLVLAGAGLYAYSRSRRPVPAKAARRGRRAGAQRRPAAAGRTMAAKTPVSAPAGFCTQCGQKRVAGDRFCRHCGAPL